MMGNVGLLLSPAAKFKKYFNNIIYNERGKNNDSKQVCS